MKIIGNKFKFDLLSFTIFYKRKMLKIYFNIKEMEEIYT